MKFDNVFGKKTVCFPKYNVMCGSIDLCQSLLVSPLFLAWFLWKKLTGTGSGSDSVARHLGSVSGSFDGSAMAASLVVF